jgi:hypothetical protein
MQLIKAWKFFVTLLKRFALGQKLNAWSDTWHVSSRSKKSWSVALAQSKSFKTYHRQPKSRCRWGM